MLLRQPHLSINFSPWNFSPWTAQGRECKRGASLFMCHARKRERERERKKWPLSPGIYPRPPKESLTPLGRDQNMEEEVWLQHKDDCVLFDAEGGHLDVKEITQVWGLDPSTLVIASCKVETDHNGVSTRSIDAFRGLEEGRDGSSKEKALTVRSARQPSDDINWTEALKLEDDEKKFIDGYLSGHYGLCERDTGIAKVPMYLDTPSMLLFNVGHPGFTHSSALKELMEKAKSSKGRSIIISGAPGCGKTRSVYDLFSEEDGLYFVMSTELNGGSNDLTELMNRLERHICLSNSKSHSDSNRNVVKCYVLLLLACRMIVYEYCKEKGASSRQWLLLQAACRGFVGQDGGRLNFNTDVFLNIFRRMVKVLPYDTEMICQQQFALEELLGQMKIPTIVVDEGQLAMKKWPENVFWSVSSGAWVPFCNPLESALRVTNTFDHIVVICGTGYTLYFQHELVGTGVAKIIAPRPNLTNFYVWKDPEDMKNFVEKVVELSDQDKELLSNKTSWVFRVFKGRCRPFANIVELMISKGLSLRAAATYVKEGLTTKNKKPELPKTFYMKVKELSSNDAMRNGLNLLAVLERAVLSYFGSGRGICERCIDKEICIEAIEAGIGMLVIGEEYSLEFKEYLVLEAAKNFFEDEYSKNLRSDDDQLSFLSSKLLDQMANIAYASPQGLFYQNFVASAFECMWKHHKGYMSKMPLFEPLLSAAGCPSHFRDLAKRKGELLEGLMNVFVHDLNYNLDMFLEDTWKDQQLCTSYICEDKVGADVVRGIRYKLLDGEVTVHCFEQDKYLKNPLSEAEMEEALEKTGIRKDLLENRWCSKLQLRILYICPQSRKEDWEPAFWKGSVGTIIIDSGNAHYMFGNRTTMFLDALKKGTMALEESKNRAH